MGCDIHVFLEKRIQGEDRAQWDSFTYAPINPGRDYQRFGRLAGVRDSEQEHIEPRGLPSDLSWAVAMDYWMFISEEPGNGEHHVKAEDAERWVLQGLSVYRDGKKEWVSDPDQHTHSWLTLDEWTTALEPFEDVWGADWHALTAAAISYANNGHDVRFVFYFDN